jgi:hypothetical protein
VKLKRKVTDWLEHRTGIESAVKSFLYEDILEHRTGIESAVKSFLYEDIPGSAGWQGLSSG